MVTRSSPAGQVCCTPRLCLHVLIQDSQDFGRATKAAKAAGDPMQRVERASQVAGDAEEMIGVADLECQSASKRLEARQVPRTR